MNRITLRTLLVILLAAGMILTATSCKQEKPEAVFAPETAETTAPAVTTAPAETILPAETQPPTTLPAETLPQEERFLLTFVGDCTFGSHAIAYYADFGFINTVGEDYLYPFRNVIEYFENDEWSIINLEGPLCDSGTPSGKKYTFRGPSAYIDILTRNSIEAVTLANNHSQDYGSAGYESTTNLLNSANIPYVERDVSTVVTTKNGLTIGIYGAVYYLLDVPTITQEIRALREQGVDLVIFAPHWGNEGSYVPSYQQVEVGHAAIDAGADIVYGSHPHVLQPVESYNGGVIYYSLGNFSFGGNGAPRDLDTVIIQQEVIRDADGNVHLGAVNSIPASVSSIRERNNYQPTPYEAGTEDYDRVLSKLNGTWDVAYLPINQS